jgi:hypothetical protein
VPGGRPHARDLPGAQQVLRDRRRMTDITGGDWAKIWGAVDRAG